jgi:hypothetical protein
MRLIKILVYSGVLKTPTSFLLKEKWGGGKNGNASSQLKIRAL